MGQIPAVKTFRRPRAPKPKELTGFEHEVPPAVLVAIDPGISGTGWCITTPCGRTGALNAVLAAADVGQWGRETIQAYGEIGTRATDSHTERLRQIHAGLVKLRELITRVCLLADTSEAPLFVVEYPAIAGRYKRNETEGEDAAEMNRGMQANFDKLHDVTGVILGTLFADRARVKVIRAGGIKKAIKQTIAQKAIDTAHNYRLLLEPRHKFSTPRNALDATYLAHYATIKEVWKAASL